MKIVIEYVLLENMFINFVTLKTTALLTKEKAKWLWLSAFFGACLTVALPSFSLNVWGYLLSEMGLTIIAVCLSFKFKTLKKFLHIYIVFFFVTLFYGGVCFFYENLFGLESMLLMLCFVCAIFVIVSAALKKLNKKRQIDNFCFDVEINNKGQTYVLKGFLDSGNLLQDPLTNKPVALINFKLFSAIFKGLELEDVLRKSEKLKCLRFAHYINFNTLNCSDKILVFEIDQLKIGQDVILEKPVLGLSLQNFNQAFGTDIILHNNMI